MKFSQSSYTCIIPLLFTLSLASCVGSSNSSSQPAVNREAKTLRFSNYTPIKDKASPREMEEFRKKDKKRSQTHLDQHLRNRETTPPKTVESLKDVLSLIPSHFLERYKNFGGIIEFDSKRFTDRDVKNGKIAKKSETDPRRIVFNTHVDKRFFTPLQKDMAVELMVKQQLALEYEKYGSLTSRDYEPTKKSLILTGYREFISQVLLDEFSGNNFENETKDFFFGENSTLHKITSNNQLTDAVIEQNISVIQHAIAKAVTYHSAMESHKGQGFLSRRFPNTNELITQLYFSPHSNHSSPVFNEHIPYILVDDLNRVMQQFNFSPDALNSDYRTYISAERLGNYIATKSDLLNTTALNARKLLEDTSVPILSRIGKVFNAGVGNSDVQAFALASIIRSQGYSADLYQIVSDKGLAQYVVHVIHSQDKEFYVDPWRGIIIPSNLFNEYYPEFSQKSYANKLNGLLPDKANTIKKIQVEVKSLPAGSVVEKAFIATNTELSRLNYLNRVPNNLYRGSAHELMIPPSDPSLLDQRMVEALKHTASEIGSAGIIQSFTIDERVAREFAETEDRGFISIIKPQAGDIVMSTKEILAKHADRLIRDKKVSAEIVYQAAEMFCNLWMDEQEYFWLLSAPDRK